MEATTTFLCKLVKGSPWQWPDDISQEQLYQYCIQHRLHMLVYHRLKQNSALQAQANNLKNRLKKRVQQDLAQLALLEWILQEILDILLRHNIQPLLIKGAALAYGYYAQPRTRPYSDIDLLIAEQDKKAAFKLLIKNGYHHSGTIQGQLLSYQTTFTHAQASIDLHWKINTSQLFAQTLLYSELAPQAVNLTAVHAQAKSLHPVHALLLACMHRIGHIHAPFYQQDGTELYAGDHLLWLYDIDQICAQLQTRDWQQLLEICVQKRICGVCLHGLQAAYIRFESPVPDFVLEQLNTQQANDWIPIEQLINGQWQWFLADLKVLSWRDRCQLVQEYFCLQRSICAINTPSIIVPGYRFYICIA